MVEKVAEKVFEAGWDMLRDGYKRWQEQRRAARGGNILPI